MIVWAGEPDAALVDCARKLDAKLLEVPDGANSRGLREVGCIPDAGPGLSEAPPGRNAAEIRGGLADGSLDAAFLVDADPVRDFPAGPAWSEALGKAKFVLAVSMFENASTKHADVVFPAEFYAEQEGTVTHPDGRLQRLRPGIPHPGHVRPMWQVLVELSALLGDETGIDSVPEALDAIASEVPFYSGITHEEIGGRGVRWQDRDAASEVPGNQGPGAAVPRGGRAECADTVSAQSAEAGAGEGGAGIRLGTYRDLWAAEATDHSPALRFLAPRQTLDLAPADADRLGVAQGDEVDVRSNGTSLRARVAIRERIRPGAGFLIEGTAEANANALRARRDGRGDEGRRRRVTLPVGDTSFVEASWILVVKSIVIFAVIFAIVPMLTVLERKVLGRFQARYGPNRVGPFGLLQPLADAVKLVTKEHYRPENAIPILWPIAPAIVVFTGVATMAIIPFGNVKDGVGFYGIDVSIGILYFFAFGSIAFYGLLLGGWASGSKYSFLGAMRSAAQLISYEISMGLALLGAIMMAGSLSLVSIVEAQNQIWYIVPQLVGFLIFMVAGFAETNRAPFDLPEADAELVAGYGTEYGGMRYGSYAMAEYIEMFVISGVAVTFFLGGWHGPGPGWLDPIWVIVKIFGFLFVFMWIRATLPRVRYDQLMSLGWKVLLPLATLNVLVTAVLVTVT